MKDTEVLLASGFFKDLNYFIHNKKDQDRGGQDAISWTRSLENHFQSPQSIQSFDEKFKRSNDKQIQAFQQL